MLPLFKLIHCHHSTPMLENRQPSSLASSLNLPGLVSLDAFENLFFCDQYPILIIFRNQLRDFPS